MLTRPIAAAQPSEVMAPIAARMVPRTDGSDVSTEPPAAPAGRVRPGGTDRPGCDALLTTAVVPRFRFHVGVSTALTAAHFFLVKNV